MLFGIEQSPCGTYLRERLDEVSPVVLIRAFKMVLAVLQHSKALELYAYDSYL